MSMQEVVRSNPATAENVREALVRGPKVAGYFYIAKGKTRHVEVPVTPVEVPIEWDSYETGEKRGSKVEDRFPAVEEKIYKS